MASGQASTEFIVMIAISLTLIIVFLALSTSSLTGIGKQQDAVDARESVVALAEAADAVYAQGDGSSRVVSIKLPQSTTFGNSTFIGKPPNAPASTPSKSIGINIGGSDMGSQTLAPLSGAFPSVPGIYGMQVLSHGSYVSIQPALLELDRQSISLTIARDEIRQEALVAYLSQSAKAANVTVSANWGYKSGGVNMLFTPANFSAVHGGTNITVAFYADPQSVPGQFNSNLVITASSESVGSETFSIPISLTVQ